MAYLKNSPLDYQTPIVDPKTGVPSPQFTRLWQAMFLNEDTTITNIEDLIAALALKADKSTQIIAGTGLDGGGDLSANRTIDLNAGIDLLTDVDTSTVPPTDGQALIWDNVASLWKPGNVSGGGGEPFKGALIFKSTDQSIPDSTGTILSWDSESYDTNGFHDNAVNNSRFTVPVGVSRIKLTANIAWATTTGSGEARLANFFKNGTVFVGEGIQRIPSITSTNTYMNLTSAIIPVVAGDYFEISVTQTSGAALDVVAASGLVTWFAIEAVADGTGGGGAAWTEVASWDFGVDGAVASVDSSSLASYTEVFIQGRLVSASVSGQRVFQVSVDGGSTYYTTSGDYNEVAVAGTEASNQAMFPHTTATTATRSFAGHFYNIAAPVKVALILPRSVQAQFVASTSALTNIRVLNSTGGNLNGGTVKIYAR